MKKQYYSILGTAYTIWWLVVLLGPLQAPHHGKESRRLVSATGDHPQSGLTDDHHSNKDPGDSALNGNGQGKKNIFQRANNNKNPSFLSIGRKPVNIEETKTQGSSGTSYLNVGRHPIQVGSTTPQPKTMAPTEDTIEVNCSSEIINFQADLIVDFFGNQSLASDLEISILEQAFQDTYNNLNLLNNTKMCDLYFRQITSVTFSRADEIARRRSLRRNVPGLIVNVGGSPFFSYHARASGKCWGCPENTQLFNDAGRRRELQTVTERLLQGSFVLLDASPADDQCSCPVQVEEYRPPTQEEFLTAFNHTVQSLKASQQIDFVESVTEVIELEEVDCSAESVIFTAEVYINLTVNDSDNWTSQEIQELDVDSYNDLADNRCDPQFRTLLNATIIDYKTMTPSWNTPL
jgi:hypothetical protein